MRNLNTIKDIVFESVLLYFLKLLLLMNFLNKICVKQLLNNKNGRITFCSFHSLNNSRKVLRKPVFNMLQKRNMSFLESNKFFKSKADRNMFIFYSTAGVLVLASISCIATWSRKV